MGFIPDEQQSTRNIKTSGFTPDKVDRYAKEKAISWQTKNNPTGIPKLQYATDVATNVVGEAGNLAKTILGGAGQAIMHPIQTREAISSGAKEFLAKTF